MLKVIISIVFAISLLNSAELSSTNGCELSQVGEFGVNFKAFKTPSKIGVGGGFDSVNYKAASLSGESLQDIFVGSSVNIETKSVNSKNPGRDAKLVESFFYVMVGKNISAKIIAIKDDKKAEAGQRTGSLLVEINMNNIVKEVPMRFTYNAGVFVAEGVIDVFDFNASKALSSINKACFGLHQGKTWNDVNIGFTTSIKSAGCE
ncbi:YceI family protein [Candidatus Sulfurimonas marisnigri]|uniref:YceI family protein n=1 Tax=Candidatus Sulfurimonas marisnigri TaxID=2740405 RepID=A0A7S7M1Z0_9BACT|nr:YceI family protein [Candidatus Sulfurimonas marisnigri]QOY55621.1 YceI family protein [Candidatus Sulfurimonas marisnigri]